MAFTYTIQQIEEALEANADFEEAASTTKALAFITAANRWLLRRPDSAGTAGSSMTFGKEFVENLLQRAQAYVAANPDSDLGGSGSVRVLTASESFR